MIFALWFLSCQYCSWNPLFNVFFPSLFFLLSFRWVSVNNVWIIPVSCGLLLSPSALPFSLHIVVWFCHQVWKDCPFSLWLAVILIKGKRQCAQRDELHVAEYRGCLSLAALAFGLSHMEIKVNVSGDWGLWSLSDVHGVHCLGLTWALLTLLAAREVNGYCI